jgi:hypothetical protein
MKRTAYRIKRTNLRDICLGNRNERAGFVTYLTTSVGRSQKYRFMSRHSPLCSMCHDRVKVISFDSLAAARRRLKVAAIATWITGFKDGDYEQVGFFSKTYRVDIVEVELETPERPYDYDGEPHLCLVSERVVQQVWPKPTILDKLAVI